MLTVHEENTSYEVRDVQNISDCSFSMSGCPVESGRVICGEESKLDSSCYTVTAAAKSLWRIIPGQEKKLYHLYIVIGAAAGAIYRRAIHNFKRHLHGVKSAVLAQKPCFLRL